LFNFAINIGDIVRADDPMAVAVDERPYPHGQYLYGVVTAIDLEKKHIDVDWFADDNEGPAPNRKLSFWAFGHNWCKVSYVPSG